MSTELFDGVPGSDEPEFVEPAHIPEWRRMLGLERARMEPFWYQVEGVKAIVDNPFFMLADDMGCGKTKQGIDSAMVLLHGSAPEFHHLYPPGQINRLLILAPASVKRVWFDEQLGQLMDHLWEGTVARIREFHSRTREWWFGKGTPQLDIIVTNYEFIGRSKMRLEQLKPFCTSKTAMYLDESTSVKNHRAEQTKAIKQLRGYCGRVLLMTGTPIANSPMDMYSQGEIMSPNILQCKSFIHFRSRYAVMGGFQQKEVIAWQNLPDLQERFKPYIVRRLKRHVLRGLKEPLPPVMRTVALTDETWAHYKQMRDEMVAWLSQYTVSAAPQAGTKSVRLAQITSGFIGGVENALEESCPKSDDGEHVEFDNTGSCGYCGFNLRQDPETIQMIGREKLDSSLAWNAERFAEAPNGKHLVWFRFVPELQRYLNEVQERFPRVEIGCIAGKAMLGTGMTKAQERDVAERLLNPKTTTAGPAIVAGTYGTGGVGGTYTACHTVLNSSYDFSNWKDKQTRARIDRIGQLFPPSYTDLVATGPNGQKTFDHHILASRLGKENIASWTEAAWIRALNDE